MTQTRKELRYPIGEFEPPAEVTDDRVRSWIDDLETLPKDLRALVEPMDEDQLDTRYRPGGWTVRQVVHHLADSHMNSFIRFKWALTEHCPTIKTYSEDLWAELEDSRVAPVAVSMDLLDSLHRRWCGLLRSLSPEELHREFIHPVTGPVFLSVNIGIYAWHGRHHLMHIQRLAEREQWLPGLGLQLEPATASSHSDKD